MWLSACLGQDGNRKYILPLMSRFGIKGELLKMKKKTVSLGHIITGTYSNIVPPPWSSPFPSEEKAIIFIKGEHSAKILACYSETKNGAFLLLSSSLPSPAPTHPACFRDTGVKMEKDKSMPRAMTHHGLNPCFSFKSGPTYNSRHSWLLETHLVEWTER